MTIIQKQWKLILGVFGVILLVGAGIMIRTVMATTKEQKAQEKFFMIEKKYTDYKEKKNAPPPDLKNTKAAPATTPEALALELTEVKGQLEKFVTENPVSKATQMAALYFSEILKEEKNKELALSTLQKVQTQDTGLVNTLVQQQIGQLLADSNKCQDAIDIWQKIVARKEASFLHNEVKIQQALCYQQLNNSQKAEELLTNIANQKPDGQINSTTTKDAAKYLRLLQMKKVSGI
ncbi:MAG: hypothetical protein A2622_12185 [Bdellovibrionales bacterium RIFCSPHIGHO2_01_FULL_40_29]|nr:MAG: hypothetical protein A2622_12185 [Bdellovibrionales bacterium RIFCSPHIGHO2_01_FULL_40_29]OFZ32947.1 MAG: hypothetical protein A3D17_09490 [Bdellovibrionales bacterium RIFCSPHIGHO2_02_FULL_40_15]